MMLPSFSYMRAHALNEFHTLRGRAQRASWVARILRKDNSPQQFGDLPQQSALHTKRFAGTRDIRVDQIIGTMGRLGDFDREFRPLQKHLRDRWTDVFLLFQADGWQPIIVHQVGETFFVEDGHHRVSVARSVGMAYIAAEVWEHSLAEAAEQVEFCELECIPLDVSLEAACTA